MLYGKKSATNCLLKANPIVNPLFEAAHHLNSQITNFLPPSFTVAGMVPVSSVTMSVYVVANGY
jgi:hypothetical protein